MTGLKKTKKFFYINMLHRNLYLLVNSKIGLSKYLHKY